MAQTIGLVSHSGFALPPPHFSQWGSMAASVRVILEDGDPAEVYDWRADGYVSADEYRLWSDNSCGVACLQGLLCAAGRTLPPKAELVRQLTVAGAYVSTEQGIKGMIYDPCVAWVAEHWGLDAVTHRELTVQGIRALVAAGAAVVASVSWDIRTRQRSRPQPGGHLVLVHGLGRDRQGHETFLFDNPSGLAAEVAPDGIESASGAEMPAEEFARFFAGRGMSFRRSPRTARGRRPGGTAG